ncbi:hypothetical protein KAT08_03815 [Candidatus Babeliales bacterium]|nr:hypothetical protein [Candidatus Babeliales bacterium]
MINFNNFPIKELILRILAVIFVISSFIITSTFIKKRQIDRKPLKTIAVISNETEVEDLPSNKQQKNILALVEKLNSHIEEQTFLLSQANKDKSQLSNLIGIIKKRLNLIEQKASENKIENLIDKPQIDQIKKDIKTYQKSFIKNI